MNVGRVSPVLAIDIGTSSCVVSHRDAAGRSRIVDVEGSRRTPSVVFAGDDGELIAGAAAVRLAQDRPERAVRSPTAQLGRTSFVVLGGRRRAPAELFGAYLAWLHGRATELVGPVAEVVLAHPASWSTTRATALMDAATAAGLPSPRLVSAPIAASRLLASELRPADGELVAAYDLGATFDTAILRWHEDGAEVVGRAGGDETLGGDLFDELLAGHLRTRLDDVTRSALEASEDPCWQAAASRLLAEARRAKEQLSSHPHADVTIALPDRDEPVVIRVGRETFDRLLTPHLARTVAILVDSIAAHGTSPLRAVQLVGGGSAIPLVSRFLYEHLPGVPVVRHPDPAAVVALGAVATCQTASAPRPTNRRRIAVSALAVGVATVLLGAAAAQAASGGRSGKNATDADQLSRPATSRHEAERAAGSPLTSAAPVSATTPAATTSASSEPGPTAPASTAAPAPAPGALVPQNVPAPTAAAIAPVTPTGGLPAAVTPVTAPAPAAPPAPPAALPSAPPAPTPVFAPGPVADAVVQSVWVAGGDCVPIRSCTLGVRLGVSAPAEDGGAPVVAYLVTRTVYSQGSIVAGPLTERVAATATIDLQMTELDLPASYVRWDVAAENTAGTGPATTASVVVPQLVGTGNGTSYELGRVAGLLATGAPPQPGCGPEYTVCSQSIAAGAVVAAGTVLSLVQPS